MRPVIHSIYLYQPPGPAFLNNWIYYRVASINTDEAAGTLGAPIEVCRVAWPKFDDIPPATDTQGITERASAYDHMCRLLRQLYGVEHENSILIGMLSPEGFELKKID